MKITFILPIVTVGGGIKVVGIYAKALTEKGHDVVLISLPPQKIWLRSKIKSLLTGHGWPRYQPPRSHLDVLGLDHRMLKTFRPVTEIGRAHV